MLKLPRRHLLGRERGGVLELRSGHFPGEHWGIALCELRRGLLPAGDGLDCLCGMPRGDRAGHDWGDGADGVLRLLHRQILRGIGIGLHELCRGSVRRLRER